MQNNLLIPFFCCTFAGESQNNFIMNLKNIMYGAIILLSVVLAVCAISITSAYCRSKKTATVEIDYGNFTYREPVDGTYDAACKFHKLGYDYQRAEERVDKNEQMRYELENRR